MPHPPPSLPRHPPRHALAPSAAAGVALPRGVAGWRLPFFCRVGCQLPLSALGSAVMGLGGVL